MRPPSVGKQTQNSAERGQTVKSNTPLLLSFLIRTPRTTTPQCYTRVSATILQANRILLFEKEWSTLSTFA
jgi:hypothetical protein